MSNLADDSGTDLEIYRRAFSPVIYADTRTGAPEELLRLLDVLGFDRHSEPPLAVWHQIPDHLPEQAQRKIASIAAAGLGKWGYNVNLDPELFDQDAYDEALAGPARHPAAEQPVPPAPPPVGPTRQTR